MFQTVTNGNGVLDYILGRVAFSDRQVYQKRCANPRVHVETSHQAAFVLFLVLKSEFYPQ
jgi:hypothetical protein